MMDRPVPSPANALGAKGAGEAGATGAIPTLANAVLDALKPLNIDAVEMPYTPAGSGARSTPPRRRLRSSSGPACG